MRMSDRSWIATWAGWKISVTLTFIPSSESWRVMAAITDHDAVHPIIHSAPRTGPGTRANRVASRLTGASQRKGQRIGNRKWGGNPWP